MGTESGLRRRVSGLSEAEFWQRFGTEEACRAVLFQLALGGQMAAAPAETDQPRCG
jgi:hypothetical protein